MVLLSNDWSGAVLRGCLVLGVQAVILYDEGLCIYVDICQAQQQQAYMLSVE